ncbi:MAG: double-strand break repair protein AddB, partial [Micropepsaceae bacterium]
MRRINLFTIPAGAAFADELARGVLARFSDAHDPFVLSRVLILLPTRRAIRTLSDAFVRVSARAVTVLPRMRALGDFDDAPSLLDDLSEDLASESVATLAPPMLPLRREFLLTKLVQRWSESEERRALGTTTPALALKLARELIALLDQATAEGLAWERLAAEFASDPSTHRDAALRRAAETWRTSPPDHPIVAAGSTGSVPATAELLKTIAYLPNGAVVLPGIDLALDGEAWEATEAGHPQHGMRQLLLRMDATRGDVEKWSDAPEPRAARVRLLAEALRPAETTPAWRDFVGEEQKLIAEGLRGLSTVVARTQAEEALAIALAMREAVETPGKTAALVTPDRMLARRVAGELKRWGIGIDDSAGTPLAHTLPGRFLCLIADAAAEEFAPVPLLALLKHPLTALWFAERSEARRLATALEEEVLRGLRPGPGLQGLRRIVDPKLPTAELVRRLETGYGPLASAMVEGTHDLRVLARLHREAAEMLSALADSAEQPLWEHEAGEAALELFAAIDAASLDAGLQMSGSDYAAFIREVMETVPVRPHIARHARLSILGPLEVRLQHA